VLELIICGLPKFDFITIGIFDPAKLAIFIIFYFANNVTSFLGPDFQQFLHVFHPAAEHEIFL
jgi:hypothetical protein